MTSQAALLALAVFGASAVESVEALTIVLAVGATRGWRSALEGAAAALAVLAVVVGAVGVPLVTVVPIGALRVVVGALLLTLGLQWLRKAVLRASGHKALHDEDEVYAETIEELGRSGSRRDATGFVVSFKGVLLEGLEVALIVLSLGSSSHRLGLASVAAGAAVVVVVIVGALVARQLSQVPENTIKTVVGVMLTSFGVFWVGEGAGIHWPGEDAWILALVGFFAIVAAGLVVLLRRTLDPGLPGARRAADRDRSAQHSEA
jgi:Ca2+/H+ antiporter, TMEM165/GDT1 family